MDDLFNVIMMINEYLKLFTYKMDCLIIYLYKVIMRYFEDFTLLNAVHAPKCKAWIDRSFPDFYALNFAAGGRIRWVEPSGRSIILPAPVAWWTWPQQRFVYGACEGETWDHYYVLFRGKRGDRMYNEGLANRKIQECYIPINDPVLFRQRFDALVALFHSSPSSIGQAVNLLEVLYLQTHDRIPASPKASRLQTLITKIRSSPQQAWNFDEEARRLSYSPVHFRRSFKKLTEKAPHQFLIQARMDWAGRLLRQTHLPIKEVASQSGYEDIFHFSKAFKRHSGFPPVIYRNNIRVFD
jgi:AraC-like DNA-binding protein